MSLSVTVNHFSLISHAPSVHVLSNLFVVVFYCLQILSYLILMVLLSTCGSYALQMRLGSVYFSRFYKGNDYFRHVIWFGKNNKPLLPSIFDWHGGCRFTTFTFVCVCVYTYLKKCFQTFAIFSVSVPIVPLYRNCSSIDVAGWDMGKGQSSESLEGIGLSISSTGSGNFLSWILPAYCLREGQNSLDVRRSPRLLLWFCRSF